MEEKKLQKMQETSGCDTGADKMQTAADQKNVSETWAEETIADLDDFIESQGIYIRQ